MRFSEAMHTVTRHGDGWQATVSEDWLQGRSAFGGLQAALALRAMRELVPADMTLRTLQVTFIAPVPAGSVAIRARCLRTGRSVIQVEASLCDGEQTLCRLLGVFGSARPSALDFQPEQPHVEAPAPQELHYVEGRMPAFTQHFRANWLRGGLPFSGGQQRDSVLLLSLRDRYDDLGMDDWRVDAELIAARDGYTNQGVMLWGSSGEAVALSRQSMVVFG
ncbi:MAG: thioesterase family protein [Rhodanobacter sp.]|nr:thioesterase family protein [Rhodanobacter sp.]